MNLYETINTSTLSIWGKDQYKTFCTNLQNEFPRQITQKQNKQMLKQGIDFHDVTVNRVHLELTPTHPVTTHQFEIDVAIQLPAQEGEEPIKPFIVRYVLPCRNEYISEDVAIKPLADFFLSDANEVFIAHEMGDGIDLNEKDSAQMNTAQIFVQVLQKAFHITSKSGLMLRIASLYAVADVLYDIFDIPTHGDNLTYYSFLSFMASEQARIVRELPIGCTLHLYNFTDGHLTVDGLGTQTIPVHIPTLLNANNLL